VRVDEHTIYLDESPVFYRDAEAPGVPRLYLHGIPTSSDDWLEFLDRTGGIAPDLLGFGRSGKGGHLDYSLTGLADFVEDFLALLEVEEAQIVGHDWGAAVGLTFAARHPDRVRELVLCDPPPLIEGFEWPRLLRLWRMRGVGELLMGATSRALLARTLRRGSVQSNAWPDARIATVWSQFDQGTQRAILRLVRSAGDNMFGGGGPRGSGSDGGARGVGPRGAGSDGSDVGPRGGGPRRAGAGGDGGNGDGADGDGAPAWPPTVLLWGESDPWYPPALGDAYAARLPGARVERIAGAGHWPWLDRPEVVERVAALLEA
jgi:pimeloyl-ACP methyl ester carboxylesterase